MIRFHTAQMNVGKVLKESNNVLFVDITVKSATAEIKALFAPTWELLKEYKAWAADSSTCTSDAEAYYTKVYYSLLEERKEAITAWVRNVGFSDYTDIVLGCYCGKDGFCHRKLLLTWLELHFNIATGGEIVSSDVSVVDSYRRGCISFISDDIGLKERIYETYKETPSIYPVSNETDALFENMRAIMPTVSKIDVECRLSRAIGIMLYTAVIIDHITSSKNGDVLAIDCSGLVGSDVPDVSSCSRLSIPHWTYTVTTIDEVIAIIDAFRKKITLIKTTL